MCLLAPWLVEEDCSHHALTGTAQSRKVRTQSLEVLIAPTLYLIVTANRIWLLPEVEVEFLVGNCRQ